MVGRSFYPSGESKMTNPENSVNAFITNLVEEADGKISTAKIRAYLLIEGYADNDKAANALIRAAGYAAARGRKGFRAELYAALIEGPVDSDRFAEMISGASENTKKHIKHYRAIADLVNRVWAKSETVTEEEMFDEMLDSVNADDESAIDY